MSETVRVTAGHIANGRPGDQCHCPIALAVKEQLGAEKVYVDMVNITVERGAHDLEALLPPVASHFVDAFDHGHPVEPFEFTVTLQDWTADL